MKKWSVPLTCLIAVVIGVIFCGACSKKVDCPAYSNDLLDAWFPYTNNQVLVFKSAQSEADTVLLNNIQTSESYQTTGSPERAAVCKATKSVRSEQRDTAGSYKFYLQLSTGDDGSGAQLYLQRTSISFSGFTGTTPPALTIGNHAAVTQSLSGITIGNRNFTSVVESKVDTAIIKSAGIYKLYFVKGEGIVGYSIYPSLKTWVKQ